MTQPCLEIVTYHSVADCDAEGRRAEAVALAQSLRGFAGWLPLSGASDARADIVVWASEEAARAAGQIVGAAPQFAPFRDSIATFGSMGHFDLPCGALPLMQAAGAIKQQQRQGQPAQRLKGQSLGVCLCRGHFVPLTKVI